jgi:flavin reductase (DIM6/NTAB) family NADH-FMN oxidoreductase RutF
MEKKAYPLSKVYQLLEPGPVVMVSTARKGVPNVMTLSWLMMIDFEPPLLGFVLSNRNFSFDILKETKERVINIPSAKLAPTVVGVGNTTGKKVDKFEKFGLTPAPAAKVKAPLIDECFANLECKVVDMQMVEKYNIFILKVLKAWMAPRKTRPKTLHHWGNGVFTLDGKVIKIPSKKK